jgi:uncharacterized protein
LINSTKDVPRMASISPSEAQALLFDASKRGDLLRVEEAISLGADVGARNRHRSTPLHFAAYAGANGLVDFLIARGADVFARNDDDAMPIYYSQALGHDAVTEKLEQAMRERGRTFSEKVQTQNRRRNPVIR